MSVDVQTNLDSIISGYLAIILKKENHHDDNFMCAIIILEPCFHKI